IAGFLVALKASSELSGATLVGIGLILLALSLDILRWFYGHVCLLLDPAHAMHVALRQAKKTIQEYEQLVNKWAANLVRIRGAQVSAEEMKDLEASVYEQAAGYPETITFWIDEISEIATKGVTRRDRSVVLSAIVALREMHRSYLVSRKDNLLVYPSP